MVIVGHRGACGYAPENTLKSFSKALELGCLRVELDVHVSADGVPVVIHDSTLDRTTDGRGPVRNQTLRDLKRLDAGEGEQIPTLLEVMELCREKAELQIELKDPLAPPLVARLIQKNWNPEKAVITSFDRLLLAEFGALLPEIPRGLLARDPSLDLVVIAREQGHRWICPRQNIVNRSLVQSAHAARIQVYVYHVNDARIARELFLWGVDAIGTDYPDLLSR